MSGERLAADGRQVAGSNTWPMPTKFSFTGPGKLPSGSAFAESVENGAPPLPPTGDATGERSSRQPPAPMTPACRRDTGGGADPKERSAGSAGSAGRRSASAIGLPHGSSTISACD